MRYRMMTYLMILGMLVVSANTIAQNDSILRYPILAEPTHLNPFTSTTIAVNTVIRNLFEGLTQTDTSTGDVLPAIADSWIIRTLDDGKQVYTFNLKQGLLYHQIDGVTLTKPEVTAEDILWNYKLALHPDQDISERAGSLRFIDGAEEYQAAVAELGEDAPPVVDDIDLRGVVVLDDYTIQITLAAADRLFLTDGMIAMTSPEAYDQLGAEFDRIPVGTGPYQFEAWVPGEEIRIVPNPNYYDPDLPRNDGVIFRLYESEMAVFEDYVAGEVDVLLQFPQGERSAIAEEFSDEFFDLEGLHIRYWGFNMADGFFSDKPLLRQAFSHTLDRETAWLDLAEGARLPANLGMLPPAMPASTPECIYDYDLGRASDLLAEAGYPEGEGLPTITIYALDAIASEPQVALWTETLSGLGVAVELVIEDSTTYWDSIETENAMIFQTGWATSVIDPSTVFDFIILDGGGSIRYDNPAVNDLLREARIELELDNRVELYQEVHDTVMCEAVVIPSAYSRLSWLQHAWVDDFNPGGGGTHTTPLWQVEINR